MVGVERRTCTKVVDVEVEGSRLIWERLESRPYRTWWLSDWVVMIDRSWQIPGDTITWLSSEWKMGKGNENRMKTMQKTISWHLTPKTKVWGESGPLDMLNKQDLKRNLTIRKSLVKFAKRVSDVWLSLLKSLTIRIRKIYKGA